MPKARARQAHPAQTSFVGNGQQNSATRRVTTSLQLPQLTSTLLVLQMPFHSIRDKPVSRLRRRKARIPSTPVSVLSRAQTHSSRSRHRVPLPEPLLLGACVCALYSTGVDGILALHTVRAAKARLLKGLCCKSRVVDLMPRCFSSLLCPLWLLVRV